MRRTRAGQRRERIRFERLGAAASGYVSGSETWSTLFTCWAEVLPARAGADGEEVIADNREGVTKFEIVVRYCSELADLSADDRAIGVHSGVRYEISSVVDPDGLRRSLLITAETGKPKG